MALNLNSAVAVEPYPARVPAAVSSIRNLRLEVGVLVVVSIIVGVIVTGPA